MLIQETGASPVDCHTLGKEAQRAHALLSIHLDASFQMYFCIFLWYVAKAIGRHL